VAVSLKLPNLRGLHARVESLADPYNVICSRAFAALPDFVTWSRAALAEGGVWMAMKGKHPQDEIDALPPGVNVFHVEPLAVPGLDVERCMVWMKPQA
jgi:16S rRNA (guanine527-N7)-methyltransferase